MEVTISGEKTPPLVEEGNEGGGALPPDGTPTPEPGNPVPTPQPGNQTPTPTPTPTASASPSPATGDSPTTAMPIILFCSAATAIIFVVLRKKIKLR